MRFPRDVFSSSDSRRKRSFFWIRQGCSRTVTGTPTIQEGSFLMFINTVWNLKWFVQVSIIRWTKKNVGDYYCFRPEWNVRILMTWPLPPLLPNEFYNIDLSLTWLHVWFGILTVEYIKKVKERRYKGIKPDHSQRPQILPLVPFYTLKQTNKETRLFNNNKILGADIRIKCLPCGFVIIGWNKKI